jgi:hypothetical protein
MNAYRMLFSVVTGDGKIVGIFSYKVNAITFIENNQPRFTSELRINEIYTDFIQYKGGS